MAKLRPLVIAATWQESLLDCAGRLAVDRSVYAIVCIVARCRCGPIGSNGIRILDRAATFPYAERQAGLASPIAARVTHGWEQVATSLQKLEHIDNRVTLSAIDFDEIVDAPIVCGNVRSARIRCRGQAALFGECGWRLVVGSPAGRGGHLHHRRLSPAVLGRDSLRAILVLECKPRIAAAWSMTIQPC